MPIPMGYGNYTALIVLCEDVLEVDGTNKLLLFASSTPNLRCCDIFGCIFRA